ncbi:NACHT domain-containing protein [Lentzea sp. NPDC058450]|uniref:NACHT domain-containing protein n=1 Tax=Lentzea sp. NPDC058450 TaxID=3346505 RepID=UPI00364BBD47
MGLELAAARLGQTIATRAATAWLATRTKEKARTSSLADLAAAELSKPVQRAKLDTLVQSISNTIAEQLEPVLQRCPEDEIEPSLAAVEVALQHIDLSDEALLADDANPEVLAQRIRRELPRQDLGRFYDIALDQSCRYLVQVIRHLPSFQPRALAEVLSRATAQVALLEDVLSRLPRTSLYAPAGTDVDDEFRDEYLRFIGANLDRLELLGLSTKDHPPLPLSVAYISLTVTGGEKRRDTWFHDPDHRAHSGVRVESALVNRTFVRGGAGSGKTTLLDWLAVAAARSGFTGNLQNWNGLVPFPIRLRAFADVPLPKKPEEFVTGWLAGIMPAGWVHRVLRAGKGLLLVDGVDEVPPHKRPKVREWLRELVQTFPSTQVVVTARPAATDEKWLADLDFSSVELEQMNPSDVKMFLHRWHEAARAPEEAQRRLVTQLESREHLQGLASSPLLCAMLCALNLGRISELPQNRMELYAAALTMLLDLRDAERGIARILTASDKTVLLRDLAWRLTLGGLSQLPTTKMHEHVTRKIRSMPNVDYATEEVVAHLLERSGVIREPVPGRVDFVHRTFQEYLAGEEAMQDGQIDTLISHAHLDSWTQTVVLACGHGQRTQVTELLNGVLARSDHEPRKARRLRLLAAACLETISDVDGDVCDRIDAIVRDRIVPPRSMKEVKSLSAIGHRVLRYLPTSLDELSEAVAAATVRSAALVGSPEAMAKLAGYAQDPREAVQEALISTWLSFDLQRYAEEVLVDAPLCDGLGKIESVRLFPHLPRLGRLTSVDIWLPTEEALPHLDFIEYLPPIRGIFTWVEGKIDLSCFAGTKPQSVILVDAQRFTNIRRLPDVTSLGLHQQRRWRNLDFLRGRSLEYLHINELAPGCDVSALAELTELRAMYCQGWSDPETISMLPPVKTLSLTGIEPIDVRPLRDRSLNLLLRRWCNYVGVDELGPDVKVRWVG